MPATYANPVLRARQSRRLKCPVVEVKIPGRMRPVPFFFDTFPRSRRPDYSRQRGEIRTRVAIVGGGLTGCACAAAFAAAGVKVVLLEANRIGEGATAGSAGLLRQDLDGSF